MRNISDVFCASVSIYNILALGSASCMRLSEATAIKRSAGLVIDGPVPSR